MTLQSPQTKEALELLKSLPPTTPVMELLRQGAALRDQGRIDRARVFIEAGMIASKRHPASLNQMAQCDIAQGQLKQAADLLQEAVERDPSFLAGWFNLGYAYEMAEKFAKAIEAYDRVLALNPGEAWALLRKGNCLNILGRQAEAIETLRRSSNSLQNRPRALANIASIDAKALTADEIARLEEAAEAKQPQRRAIAHFGLGDWNDAQRDYDSAFSHYAQGNALRRQVLGEEELEKEGGVVAPEKRKPFRKPEVAERQHSLWVERAKACFNPASLGDFKKIAKDSALPVFIVGLPRSGSTLVEQILSAHPKAHGAGEIDHFSQTLVEGLWPFGRGQQGEWLDRPEGWAEDLRRGASAYLERLRQLAPDAKRVVNKMLSNYLHIGFIAALYPRATILHTLRHPLDCALGSFRKLFGQGNELSYDLGDLGRLYLRYRDLMIYWEELLPGRVVHIVHEDLVADQEGQTRRILDACGLAWDDRCLRFFEKERAVRTASQAQVRKPISAERLERWRHYEKHLGPLIDAIGPEMLATWRPESWPRKNIAKAGPLG